MTMYAIESKYACATWFYYYSTPLTNIASLSQRKV
jgi:hypothetical protein